MTTTEEQPTALIVFLRNGMRLNEAEKLAREIMRLTGVARVHTGQEPTNALGSLTPEQRLEYFASVTKGYCKHCGRESAGGDCRCSAA